MLALVVTLQLAAAPGQQLSAAEAACYQMNYPGCLDLLQKAKAEPGNSRTALLRILELEGVTAAQLKQVMRSQDALRTLFLLDPDHKFTASYSPRVNTAILEAKAWARANGTLEVTAAPAEMRPGKVLSLGLDVARNPLQLARVARVHQRTPGAEAAFTDVPVIVGHLATKAQGAVVEWWVEVLGANDAVLLELGSERAPLTARAPEVVADVPVKRELEPAVVAVPPPQLEAAPEPVGPRFRPAAWTMMVLAVAAAGAGSYFAVSSGSARNQLEHPMIDGSGLVVGRTQAQAQALEGTMRRDALLADVLLPIGGVFAILGITLFIVGS